MRSLLEKQFFFPHSDIDECTSAVPYCSLDATCNNTKGSCQCRCKQGFSGDGKECEGENLRFYHCIIKVVINIIV